MSTGLRCSVLVGALLLALGCSSSGETSPPMPASGGVAGGPSGSSGASTASGGTPQVGGTNAGGTNAGAGGTNAGSGGTPINGGSGADGGRGGVSFGGGGSAGTMSVGGGTAGSGADEPPGVRIVGRTESNGDATRFGWPGVAFRARFSGTQASIQLLDGNNQNAFEVVVDGGAPKKFRTTNGQSAYPVASGLADGNHELLVWRSTEVFDSGTTDFMGLSGFSSGGALLAPPAAPNRRMEVIGDSISVGAGLEGGSSNCAADKNSTDNYFAYGSIAARALGADLSTIAYSGIGVYRSYSASDPTMPARYDRALPGNPAAWDFSKYQPHVVVINLGTNDFGAGDPGAAYVTAYVDFAKHVRSRYSGAYLVLIAMYGNQESAINEVLTTLQAGGESRIELLKLNDVQNNKGCAQHPDAAAQKAMGELLTTRIKDALSW